MSLPGDHEKARAPEGSPAQRLEWQSELDSAMLDLDSKLSHPRRRASDVAPQPMLPQLGQVDITSELLDEIAWRVAEQMRRSASAVSAPEAPIAAAPLPPPAPAPVTPLPPVIPEGVAVVIRLRRPLFSWKFWRRRSRRRQQMITLSDYRVT
jgi:hypothetical protein